MMPPGKQIVKAVGLCMYREHLNGSSKLDTLQQESRLPAAPNIYIYDMLMIYQVRNSASFFGVVHASPVRPLQLGACKM